MKLTEGFNLLATAPDGIKRLRELILSLAVQGKLVPQDPNEEPASELLKKIRAEKDRLIAEGKIKKDKPLPAIGDDEKPFALPEGWEWVRFDELVDIAKPISYGVLVPGPEVENGVPFVRIGDIAIKNAPVRPEKKIAPEIDAQYSRTRLEGGEILMGVVGSIGKLGIAPVTWAGANIARALCRIAPAKPIQADFVVQLLQTRFMQSSFGGGTRTLAQPTLNIGLVRGALAPLPPLAEQSRIVAKVEELMALCDALETRGQLEAEQHARLTATLFDALAASESAHQLQENWARLAASFDLVLDRPQAVDALEQTILQLAVRGLLVPQDPADEPASELLKQIRAAKDRLIAEGKIKKDKPLPAISDDEKPFDLPNGWAWVRFGDAGINRDGERIPVSLVEREQRAKVYDYYGASGVIDKIDGYLFDKTLLLIGEDGANLINRSTPIAFLAHGKYWVNNHAHVIDATHDGLLDYLGLFVNAISLEPYVTGTAQPKMNQAKLNSIVVMLPPLREQVRIVARVEALRALCGQLRERLAASRHTQANLAEALVAQT